MTVQAHPTAPTSERFRRAMGRVPTGVAVVSVAAAAGVDPVGITVGSLAHVSSEPPLVAFYLQRTSARAERILAADQLGVSVLARDQADEALRFASSRGPGFDGLAVDLSAAGSPRIRGAVLWLEVRITFAFDAGDHTGVLAEVVDFDAPPGHERPLAFYRSKLVSLNPAAGRHIPTEALGWW
jgi:flavin reductase (DIM6/NTAB) family NADH-FMN oxidoreductase RutF